MPVKLWILSLLLWLGAACTSQPLVVAQAPPPARKEERPLKPGTGVFWKSGHFAWRPDSGVFYWVSGSWESLKPGYLWLPGYWIPTEGSDPDQGWRWMEPRWERQSTQGDPPPRR